MAQTLTTDLEQIDGGEAADINSSQSLQRRYQLPEVVDSSPTGTQIADLTLLKFTNNGQGICKLHEYETQREVFVVKPFEVLTLRAVLDDGNGEVGWQRVDLQETIVAATPDAHIAALSGAAVTSVDSAAANSSTDTYTEADAESAFNTALDTAIGTTASFELDFDAAIAEMETKINGIIDVLEDQNVSAAA